MEVGNQPPRLRGCAAETRALETQRRSLLVMNVKSSLANASSFCMSIYRCVPSRTMFFLGPEGGLGHLFSFCRPDPSLKTVTSSLPSGRAKGLHRRRG